jgi:hypothetical protein
LARLFQASRDAWKAKALDKQRRLRAAQVKIRDLEASRAYWKDRTVAAEGGCQPSASEATPPGEPDEAAQRLRILMLARDRHPPALAVKLRGPVSPP